MHSVKPLFYLLLLLSFGLVIGCRNQHILSDESIRPSSEIVQLSSPKLVVGIVVDQMRYDYIYRYWEDYSDRGFKRLISHGFFCENHHFDYAPTYTGPGHASIYTGTTPEMHGIIANDWWDKENGKMVYCVSDSSFQGVGTSSNYGRMAPSRLLATTITDQLKLATNQRSKTIGISLKDRGAILPAGHLADAAYWFAMSLCDLIVCARERYRDGLICYG